MSHGRFEWDEAKAEANRRKHGIGFDAAANVLADPFAEQFHLDHPRRRRGEDSWLTLASHPARRRLVLATVWAERNAEAGPVTRIISARKATRQERERYEQEIF